MDDSHKDVPAPNAFQVHEAAAAGAPPEEAATVLTRAAAAVREALGEDASGTVGLRFGHRVLVASVNEPASIVDIADLDVQRRTLLTVGGLDPGPEGALLAQVLFLRADRVVGHLDGAPSEGPAIHVLEAVLPPLRDADAARVDGVGAIALGRSVEELAAALGGEPHGD